MSYLDIFTHYEKTPKTTMMNASINTETGDGWLGLLPLLPNAGNNKGDKKYDAKNKLSFPIDSLFAHKLLDAIDNMTKNGHVRMRVKDGNLDGNYYKEFTVYAPNSVKLSGELLDSYMFNVHIKNKNGDKKFYHIVNKNMSETFDGEKWVEHIDFSEFNEFVAFLCLIRDKTLLGQKNEPVSNKQSFTEQVNEEVPFTLDDDIPLPKQQPKPQTEVAKKQTNTNISTNIEDIM